MTFNPITQGPSRGLIDEHSTGPPHNHLIELAAAGVNSAAAGVNPETTTVQNPEIGNDLYLNYIDLRAC